VWLTHFEVLFAFNSRFLSFPKPRDNLETTIMKLTKALVAGLMSGLALTSAHAQNEEPINLGVVTFLSGPAASPFGVPARNAAELMIQEFNAGKAPAPYNNKGFGGSPIKMTIIDEAGSSTSVVTEFRNLVQRDKVDLIVGYISSGNCLAIAPVAEELKAVTFLFDCGTPRIFEESAKNYVFRAVNQSYCQI
jgi:branched-chain amino acid transport system substrate-binding protein